MESDVLKFGSTRKSLAGDIVFVDGRVWLCVGGTRIWFGTFLFYLRQAKKILWYGFDLVGQEGNVM